MDGTNDSSLLGPTTLWGILILDRKAGPGYKELYEPENDSWDAAFADIGDQKEYEIPQIAGDAFPGPAILWGILLSERAMFAEFNTFHNLWTAAGYDCQLLIENIHGEANKETVRINDEESFHRYQSPDPAPYPVGPYVVKESPGKGQGTFAARDVIRGERILVDKPFFIVTKPYNSRKVLDEFERMPLAKRQQYMQFFCPDRRDDINMTDVMCIFEANCFNIGDSAAVFLTASRFNHSCLPNTYYSWSEAREEIVFHSMDYILEGEEMTICYGRPLLTRLERWSELRIYNFCCSCPACEPETAFGQESELRRLALKKLEEEIIMFQTMCDEALLSYGLRDPLTAIFRLINLIKEEGLHGELMTPYHDAAEYLKGRGNFEEALSLAKLQLEDEVMCFGVDSVVVPKTVEYIEELKSALSERVKKQELEEDEEAEEPEEDSEVEELQREDETTEPDADALESGIVYRKLLQPRLRNKERDLPDKHISPRETLPNFQRKEKVSFVVESEQEALEWGSIKAPETPTKKIEELEDALGNETGESDTDGEVMNHNDPISSQSSSPRFVRKK